MRHVAGSLEFGFKPDTQDLRVQMPEADLCDVSEGTCQYAIAVMLIKMTGGTVPPEHRFALYRKYIVLYRGPFAGQEVPFGMSGGPVVDKTGAVRGVLVLASRERMLAVPSSEIVALLQH